MCELNDCIQLIQANPPYIQKEYGVTGLSIFGSLARGDNKKDSESTFLSICLQKSSCFSD